MGTSWNDQSVGGGGGGGGGKGLMSAPPDEWEFKQEASKKELASARLRAKLGLEGTKFSM
jgi:hypothetical protein